MTYEPPPPERQPYDPLTAPPVYDQPVTGPGYGEPQPAQQYELLGQYPEPEPQYQQPGYQQAGYQQPGYPPAVAAPYAVPYYPPPRDWNNGAGTTALILGIASLAGSCLVLGIPAIICGIIGMGRVRRGEANNQGMAVGGLVLGIISTLAMVALGVIFAVAITAETTHY